MTNLHSRTSPVYWITAALSVLLLTGAAALVDPTRPPDALLPESKGMTPASPLQLTAIFIYPDHRFAIINGQKASAGEKVGEYTIINIQRDTVELKGSQDNLVNLSLLPIIKKTR
jgi:hypothetical protein